MDNEKYWSDIPVGESNAVTYDDLCFKWDKNKRTVRKILHDLSLYDNGDNYVLIRSSKSKGFYKTGDLNKIEAYKKECLNKGKSNFAPVKKINRILRNVDDIQCNMINNLKVTRKSKGLSQIDVCKKMQEKGNRFDEPTLSKLENGTFLPTPKQLINLALIYEVDPSELIAIDKTVLDIYS